LTRGHCGGEGDEVATAGVGANSTPAATQTRKHANTQTRKHANTQTRKHANTQTRKHANTQTRKHANTQFNLVINKALDQHSLRQPVFPTYGHPERRHDPANGSLLGRQVRLQVVKRWGGARL
jgi:hypothetical protein